MNGIDLLAMLVFMGMLTGMVGIVSRAVLRYQDRKLAARGNALEPAVRAELEEMRAQLADQQDVRQRLLELEERVDFAERMLAQVKQERLNPGGETAR